MAALNLVAMPEKVLLKDLLFNRATVRRAMLVPQFPV
jgi:hypothetical protein